MSRFATSKISPLLKHRSLVPLERIHQAGAVKVRPGRRRGMIRCVAIIVTGAAALGVFGARGGVAATALPSAETEFFEGKIRPVLAAECYECHGAKKQKGGLRLDSRDGWKAGGDTGETIVPGQAAKSLLIKSIRHEDPDLKMPSKSPKLDDAVIADFENWVNMGAPDPRDAPPRDDRGKPAWSELLAARRGWWAFRPVQMPALPAVKNRDWSTNPVDLFLLAKMEANALKPSAQADPQTIIRRLTFTLTGLPPTPDEVKVFVADSKNNPQSAIGHAATRLLASPRFGEHWARHWMDLMRYAETHGSESDPEIPDAWRYRDYLVRAFNADVPYDQFIREQIAGDLLPKPRRAEDGVNESLLGTAQFRLVEHGYQPIDTLDDQVKAVDNQIDVVSKAFQGLTISCARCHDHKFDAISQRDYYALFGIFASCRPAMVTVDSAAKLASHDGELAALKGPIRETLADAWTEAASHFSDRLLHPRDGDPLAKLIADAAKNPANPMNAWSQLASAGDSFSSQWKGFVDKSRVKFEEGRAFNSDYFQPGWDFASGDVKAWYSHGLGLAEPFARAGEFGVNPDGNRVIDGLLPAGISTNRLSRKHNGSFTSPRFKIDSDSIFIRAGGGGGAWVRVAFDNYPLNSNPTFPKSEFKSTESGWVRFDTAYRKGSWAYLEFITADDNTRHESSAPKDSRSWFSAERVVFSDGKEPPRESPGAAELVLAGDAPRTADDLAARYEKLLRGAIAAWRMDAESEPQCALLDLLVRRDVLPANLPALPKIAGLVAEYRRLESEVPVPSRAPGVFETVGLDAPFLPRGDHLKPGDPVPRRYLEVFGGQPFHTALSGRLELAEALASRANPLTARVMVNRIWHWVFGRGLVPTVDNFGRMGDKPANPELLDFLAVHFVEHGWSVKELITFLVTSRAFQMNSEASSSAVEIDPANDLLSHARICRLEAESIRDSLLAVSGKLDFKMGGASEHFDAARRSIYLEVLRTKLNPFLQVFDSPVPFTTVGRRDSTNVPAQSLTLLNAPFVIDQSRAWAQSLLRTGADENRDSRVTRMFSAAFAREPSARELIASAAYLTQLANEQHISPDAELQNELVWQDFAQSLFNLKEFIYLR